MSSAAEEPRFPGPAPSADHGQVALDRVLRGCWGAVRVSAVWVGAAAGQGVGRSRSPCGSAPGQGAPRVGVRVRSGCRAG